MSRVGNADHGLFTEMSPIAFWRRMYDLKLDSTDMTDEVWIERAKRGNAHELAKLAEFMTKFVCEHTDTGDILHTLEEFEASQKHTRKLTGSMFKAIGDVPSHALKGPFLAAMLKAALTASKTYATGLFAPSDMTTKKIQDLKPIQMRTMRVFDGAKTYLAAHLVGAKITKRDASKLINELDFCVLFVIQINHHPSSNRTYQKVSY